MKGATFAFGDDTLTIRGREVSVPRTSQVGARERMNGRGIHNVRVDDDGLNILTSTESVPGAAPCSPTGALPRQTAAGGKNHDGNHGRPARRWGCIPILSRASLPGSMHCQTQGTPKFRKACPTRGRGSQLTIQQMTAPASPQPYDAAAALSDLEHRMPPGSTLIPLVARAKRPLTAGWADATAADLLEPGFRQLFQGEVGIGLLCGQASGGLCLVDLDLDPLVAQAEDAFPALAKAPRIHGARGAKWLVRLGSRTNGFSLRARGGAKIGEFLAERQQGVLAGIHPTTGLPYHWHRRGEIPVVDVDAIRETLATLTERKP